jgi:ribosomal protein S27E
MYHKKIFKNITYGIEGARIIMKAETGGDFINVDCPNCGAVVTMRSNGGARCAHCGTYLRSES